MHGEHAEMPYRRAGDLGRRLREVILGNALESSTAVIDVVLLAARRRTFRCSCMPMNGVTLLTHSGTSTEAPSKACGGSRDAVIKMLMSTTARPALPGMRRRRWRIVAVPGENLVTIAPERRSLSALRAFAALLLVGSEFGEEFAKARIRPAVGMAPCRARAGEQKSRAVINKVDGMRASRRGGWHAALAVNGVVGDDARTVLSEIIATRV